MKKLLLPIVMLLAGLTGVQAANDVVSLTFERTGTDANSVTVSVVDGEGAVISGATAVFAANQTLKATSNAITSAIVCPNVNATANPTIELTLTVNGLPAGFSFDNIGLDIHALNGQSNYQQSNDKVVRQWNVVSTVNDAAFGTLADIDIAAGVSTDSKTHKMWDIAGTQAVTSDGTLTLKLTITKGTENKGCFFGLSEVKFSSVATEATQAAIDAATDFLNGWAPTVGYITAEGKEAVEAALADAKTALETGEGIAAALDALQGAMNSPFETIQPEADKFYVLHNSYSGIYASVGNEAGMIATNTVGMGEVFQFVPAEDGNFYLKNVERGVYLSTNKAHQQGQEFAAATATADAKAVKIANLGAGNQVSITPVGGATIHHDASAGTIIAWTAGVNSRSSWKIEEVSIEDKAHAVTISDVQWSTLVLGYNAVIPEGVTAYAVASTNATSATLTEVTGAIPANEAVLLNGAAGTYEFKFAETVAAVEGNLLEGSTIKTNVAKEAYVLSAPEGAESAGLYKAALNQQDGTSFLNNAFKAYLPAPAGASAPMFSLERGEGTTQIENSKLKIENSAIIYDLAGRRVEKMEKGIYIVNGKKVIK